MSVIYDILSEYIMNHKLVFILYLALTLAINFITTIVLPRVISLFVESSMNKKEVFGEHLQHLWAPKTKMDVLYSLGGLFALSVGLHSFKDYIESIHIITGITNYFKKTMLTKIFEKYSKNFKEIPESSILWVANNSFSTVKMFIFYSFSKAIPYLLTFMLVSAYLYTLSQSILYIFITHVGLIAFVLWMNHRIFLNQNIKVEGKVLNNMSFIQDKVKNLMNIIFDNLIQKEVKEINDKEEELKHYLSDSYTSHNYTVLWINIISYVSLFIIFYRLMYKEGILYSTILILLLYKGIQDDFVRETLNQYYAMSKFIKMNEIVRSIDETKECQPIRAFYSIKLNNVSYKYDKTSDYILKNVNIHFEPKKINVMTGKSGSGKTTIMKLIVKLYKPTKGSIQYDELNAEDICETNVRDNIYYVNQRTILFEESVLYNLQYGNQASKEEVVQLLEKYDLLDYYTPLEFGIDSNSGVNGSHLSLGMQKIIMVVRGILKPNKHVLILDEPLTSLDKESRIKIVKLIVEETKGKTVIVISHDPEILPFADHIVRLQRDT